MEPIKEKRLIVIVGPTASGKTALAIDLAKKLQTEIISGDSRQIFKELEIGTAKPSQKELGEVPHHFINTHSITQQYDAAQFGRDALELINELFKTKNDLILCGGSGLYIKSVCEGFDNIPEIDPEIRQNLNEQFESNGLGWLQDQLVDLDPEQFDAWIIKIPTGLFGHWKLRWERVSQSANFKAVKNWSIPSRS